jgi:hypothetical protein
VAQLLSLDISCNVEIKLGTSTKHNGPAGPHEQGNFMSVRPPIAVYTFGKKVLCNIHLTILTLKYLTSSLKYFVQVNQELVITVSPDSIKLMYHTPFEW